MADEKASKGQINKELDKVQDQLSDLSTLLGDALEKQFSKSVVKVRELANSLNDVKSISKELKNIQEKNEVLLIREKVAKDNLAKALEKEVSLKENASIKQKNAAKAAVEEAQAKFKKVKAELQISQALEDQLKLTEELAEAKGKEENLNNKVQNALDKNLSSVKDQVTQFFTLTGIIGILVNGIGKADKQVVAMSKSLGINREAAQGMRDEMESYSLNAKDSFVTVERLVNAQQQLSEQLGIAVNFSNEERENFARLTELVGLSAEEAGNLAANSAALGVPTKNYVADLRKGAFEAQKANKIRISDKELLSSISKLSAGILVKFQGNPKALAAAVVQAKALGLNLEQVNKIGDDMLNWESSIEKELEAELVTGKQLNFERARAAALSNDQATLMEEIAAQAGSLAEFQGMNAMAQKSLAEAFGMSKEEMAEMLQKQEAINKYGDKAAELNEEQLKDMEKRGMDAAQYTEMLENQRSIQEKFNDLINKLQEQLVGLVDGPLGRMLSTILEILGNSTAIKAIFFALGAYMAGSLFMSLAKVGKLLKAQKAESMGAAIIQIVKGAWSSLGPIPFIGAALAAAAAIGGIAYLTSESTKEANDMVSPGYGKRTIFSPEGAIALNDKDTVIAGTNLGGGGNKGGGGGGESMGMVVAAIKDLQNSINRLASRPVTINMDGAQVGTIVGRRNETGTEQVKNSYSLA